MNILASFFPFLVFAIIMLILFSAATKKITFGPFDKGGKNAQTRGEQAVNWQKRQAKKLAIKAGNGALRSIRKLFP